MSTFQKCKVGMLVALGLLGTNVTLSMADPNLQPEIPPTRRVLFRHPAKHERQGYFLYVPKNGGSGARVLVTVHGISRNAGDQVRRFSRLADHYGVVVVGPLFPRDHFPDYQSLGWLSRGQRSDLMLQDILAEVEKLTRADVGRVHLFGYSGGGQFVHRYAMAYPRQVAAVVIGAAGWYTFPDLTVRYPRGLRPNSKQPDLRLDPGEFLKIPMAVFVGEQDFRRGLELRQSRALDMQQGLSRIERGYRWIKAMQAAAMNHGMSTRYEFHVLARAGHSFATSIKRGDLGRHVFEFLFDPSHLAPTAPTDRGCPSSVKHSMTPSSTPTECSRSMPSEPTFELLRDSRFSG